MPYVQVQQITDTDRRHVTKRVNVGTTETSVLVVNASALGYATTTLTTGASANNFKVGEVVNAASGGSAIVQDVINSSSVILMNAAGTFTPGTAITGATTGAVRTQSGALAPSTYQLHASRVVYNITGPADAKVQVEWEGTGGGANNRAIAVLTGDGALEFDSLGMRVPNNANTPTGNIILTTLNWTANAHYTLFVDVSKVGGYAAPYLDRNQILGL